MKKRQTKILLFKEKTKNKEDEILKCCADGARNFKKDIVYMITAKYIARTY